MLCSLGLSVCFFNLLCEQFLVLFVVEVPPKDSVPVREEADWDDDDPNTSQTATDTNNKWTDNANVTNENWGKELSSGTGSLSDWGTANITEDWDAPSESSFSTNWTEQKSGGVGVSNDQPVLGTIGSEMKSGKIPKKDSFFGMTDQTSSGQYGAIGEPMLKEPLNEGNTVKDFGVEKEKIKEPLYKDVIGVSTVTEVKEELSVNNAGSKYVNANTLHGSKTSSPKLTGWSGLDGFEPLPSLDSSSVDPQPSQSGSVLVDSNTKMKVEQQNSGTISRTIDPDITVKEPYNDGGMEKSTTEKGPIRSLETGRGTDDWGWTIASSKKTMYLRFQSFSTPRLNNFRRDRPEIANQSSQGCPVGRPKCSDAHLFPKCSTGNCIKVAQILATAKS